MVKLSTDKKKKKEMVKEERQDASSKWSMHSSNAILATPEELKMLGREIMHRKGSVNESHFH